MGDPDTTAFFNTSLKGFLLFDNQKDEVDDGGWAVRIEDMLYGKMQNSTSLDDQYSDLAIIDTVFPGILVPNRVWNNFKANFIANISGINCNNTETILGQAYPYCYVNTTCGQRTAYQNIYLYFNSSIKAGNSTQYMLEYPKEKYAAEDSIKYIDEKNVTQSMDVCKLLVYGQGSSSESRYLVGNAFLKSYYVALDFANEKIGFNGFYKEIEKPNPRPPTPPAGSGLDALVVILVIAGILLFASIGICVCIKKRNETLREQLDSNDKYGKLD